MDGCGCVGDVECGFASRMVGVRFFHARWIFVLKLPLIVTDYDHERPI